MLLLLLPVFLCLVSCCDVSEREALLDFKGALHDPSGRLNEWMGSDCCKWPGVRCHPHTGFVTELNLRNPFYLSVDISMYYNNIIVGKISPSLLRLTHLTHLDLSYNNFYGEPIPPFLGSLHNLVYLGLSYSRFTGTVPHQLGNLSALTHLDLCSYDSPMLWIDDSSWIARLSSLQVLNLDSVKMQHPDVLILSLNMIPSIREIHLPNCNITSFPTTIPHMNFSRVTLLELSGNNLGNMPLWLFNITTLELLDLSYNYMHGTIPDSFQGVTALKFLYLDRNFDKGRIPPSMGKLCKLQVLDLSFTNITGDIEDLGGVFSGCVTESLEELRLTGNGITGCLAKWLLNLQKIKVLYLNKNSLEDSIPESVERLLSLEELELSDNNLSGTIPTNISQLSNIKILSLGSNNLSGVVSESHFSHLHKLKSLSLSNNSLHFTFRSSWLPLFRLQILDLSSCPLGPRFPTWFPLEDKVYVLDVSSTGISGKIPEWYWSNITEVYILSMNNNSISGNLPRIWTSINFTIVDFGTNKIKGPLPPFISTTIEYLDLSNNQFSGSINPSIGDISSHLFYLDLSKNNLIGSIPTSICKLADLGVLDLSRNCLSMHIPSCWNENSFSSIIFIDLSYNRLEGEIPKEIGFLSSLERLHLNGNYLSGELPSSLKGCTKLMVLDVGDNNLSGMIRSTIFESLSSLMFLQLRLNKFSGEIPPQLIQMPSLRFLDIGHNNLSGKIPSNFSNLSSFKIENSFGQKMGGIRWFLFTAFDYTVGFLPIVDDMMQKFVDNITIISKGSQMYLSTKLQLTMEVSIDLSSNNLSGEIPVEFGELYGLRTLNLSNNHFDGRIPETLGQLKFLESLDLSTNILSGEIPHSMINMTSLSVLNVSYNNLSGRIPTENQFATFTDPSIYIGNPHLCGFPLKKSCGIDGQEAVVEFKSRCPSEKLWFYFSMLLGFIFGFWTFFGMLIVKRSWRDSYFLVLDRMIEMVYSCFLRNH